MHVQPITHELFWDKFCCLYTITRVMKRWITMYVNKEEQLLQNQQQRNDCNSFEISFLNYLAILIIVSY